MVDKEDIDRIKLNEDRVKELLNPTKRPGRVRKVDSAQLLPRRCAVTGRHTDRYFIDLGFDTGDFMGQVYICADIAENIAKMAGFIDPAEFKAAWESNYDLAMACMELLDENKTLRESLRGIDGISNLVGGLPDHSGLSDLAQSVPSENVAESSGSREAEDSGPDEQGDEQGMGDLSNFSFSGPGPTI